MDTKEMLNIFKALSEPVRLNIISYLKKEGHEVSCGQIGMDLHIPKTAGSYHFKILENSGLILTRKESRTKYVRINTAFFEEYLSKFYKDL